MTAAGRERLRQAALANKPWQHSTGPTSAAGKAKVAENGRRRQKGRKSIRQLRAELADVHGLIAEMAALRRSV